MNSNILGLMAVALLTAPAASGAATLITSSNDPALAGSTVIDFNSEAQGSFVSRTFGGFVTFSGTQPLYIESVYLGQYGSTGNYLANRQSDSPFTIAFANPVAAFGFSWGAADQPWTMELFGVGGNSLGSLSVAAQTNPFVGFIGGTDVSSLISYAVLTDSSSYTYDYFLLDDFEYVVGSTSVPEPGTLALLGLGLAGLGLSRRRKAH